MCADIADAGAMEAVRNGPGAPQRLSLSLPVLAPHPGPSAAATRCSCRGEHSCGPGLIGRCSLGKGLAPVCADTAGCPCSFQVCALHCLPCRPQGGRAISRRLGFLHFEQRPHWGNSCNCALSTACIGFHDAAYLYSIVVCHCMCRAASTLGDPVQKHSLE